MLMYFLARSCLVMYGLVWPYAAMHNFCACFTNFGSKLHHALTPALFPMNPAAQPKHKECSKSNNFSEFLTITEIWLHLKRLQNQF